jgi:hypothetical protein
VDDSCYVLEEERLLSPETFQVRDVLVIQQEFAQEVRVDELTGVLWQTHAVFGRVWFLIDLLWLHYQELGVLHVLL